MFYEYDELLLHFEGYVVVKRPLGHPFQGVNGNRRVRREGGPGNGPVELPQGIGIAEKKGENTIFVTAVDAHNGLPAVKCKGL
jgi:hypothetical protein